MNLFLHGVKDFSIINGDTLAAPAFVENGQLQQFDLVLANPPYSISQWDRAAFESDKYGRNFLGVPNQNRADFAFIQHILASMKDKTGRCAILLPHGVLNRQEERSMRQELIRRDLLECVIGVGKNLFYNSPMEACIMICRTSKPHSRIGRVLFIDGRTQVSRKGTESFLTSEQIKTIAQYYFDFETNVGYTAVVTSQDIAANDFSLAINRYVEQKEDTKLHEAADVLANRWADRVLSMHRSIEIIIEAIGGEI